MANCSRPFSTHLDAIVLLSLFFFCFCFYYLSRTPFHISPWKIIYHLRWNRRIEEHHWNGQIKWNWNGRHFMGRGSSIVTWTMIGGVAPNTMSTWEAQWAVEIGWKPRTIQQPCEEILFLKFDFNSNSNVQLNFALWLFVLVIWLSNVTRTLHFLLWKWRTWTVHSLHEDSLASNLTKFLHLQISFNTLAQFTCQFQFSIDTGFLLFFFLSFSFF